MKEAKQVVTVRLEPKVLEFVDHNARANDESRSAILNHIIKLRMKDMGVEVPDGQIVLDAPKGKRTPSSTASDLMNRVR